MTTFKEQSHAVAKCFAICLLQDRMDSFEIIESMKDAITTLNAAALTKEKLSITEDLIRVAQEFVIDAPSMDLTELVCYQNDFRKILDKLNHK